MGCDDIFMIKHRMFLCIVHYHSKVSVVKKLGSLAVDNLAQMAKIFAEYGLP